MALITMCTVFTATVTPQRSNTDDLAPDFSPLAGNQEIAAFDAPMARVLQMRQRRRALGRDRHDGRLARSAFRCTGQQDAGERSAR